jgi:hypothetical protein
MNSTTNDIEGGSPTTAKGSLAFPEEQAPATDGTASGGGAPKRKKKVILIAAIASLALIGLVVGLSVGLTRNKGSDEVGLSPEETVSSPFTESKAYITSVCSEDDKTLCEKTCEPVDCCNPFAENNCLMENAEKCMEYAMCHVVTELESIGAPSDLAQTCETASDACRAACEDVKCCFDDVDKCQDTQFLKCLDYAPCQILNKKSTVTPASPELINICLDPEEQDRGACETECEKASCCWDETVEGNCLTTDMISCMTYSPCGALLIPAANTVVDRPDNDFNEICSIDSVLTADGYADCQDKCATATCCTAAGEDNCFQIDPVGCLQHLQCGLLNLAGGSVEPADTTSLTEICNLQEILNSGPSDECKTACEPAKCCVSQDDNCLADGNVLACASYLPCLPVLLLGENGLGGFPDFNFTGSGGGEQDVVPPIFGEGTIGEPPEGLQEKCSNSDTLDECTELCKEVECCTSMGDDNCLLENVIACATWNLQGCFAVNGFQQAP